MQIFVTKDLSDWVSVYNITYLSDYDYGYSISWTGTQVAVIGHGGLAYFSQDVTVWQNFSSTGFIYNLNSLYKGHDRFISCSQDIYDAIVQAPFEFTPSNFNWTVNTDIDQCQGFVPNQDNTATYFWPYSSTPGRIYVTTDFTGYDIYSTLTDKSNASIMLTTVKDLKYISASQWIIYGSGYQNIDRFVRGFLMGVSSDNMKTWRFTINPNFQNFGEISLSIGENIFTLSTNYPTSNIYKSINFQDWDLLYHISNCTLLDSAYGNEIFAYLCSSASGTYYTYIYDGTSIKSCKFPIVPAFSLSSITYDQFLNQFIAYSYGYIYSSVDGCNWGSEYIGIYTQINGYQSISGKSLITSENGLTLQK